MLAFRESRQPPRPPAYLFFLQQDFKVFEDEAPRKPTFAIPWAGKGGEAERGASSRAGAIFPNENASSCAAPERMQRQRRGRKAPRKVSQMKNAPQMKGRARRGSPLPTPRARPWTCRTSVSQMWRRRRRQWRGRGRGCRGRGSLAGQPPLASSGHRQAGTRSRARIASRRRRSFPARAAFPRSSSSSSSWAGLARLRLRLLQGWRWSACDTESSRHGEEFARKKTGGEEGGGGFAGFKEARARSRPKAAAPSRAGGSFRRAREARLLEKPELIHTFRGRNPGWPPGSRLEPITSPLPWMPMRLFCFYSPIVICCTLPQAAPAPRGSPSRAWEGRRKSASPAAGLALAGGGGGTQESSQGLGGTGVP